MKVFNPFGPVLAKVRIPKKIVNKINLEVDKIILKDQNPDGSHTINLGTKIIFFGSY